VRQIPTQTYVLEPLVNLGWCAQENLFTLEPPQSYTPQTEQNTPVRDKPPKCAMPLCMPHTPTETHAHALHPRYVPRAACWGASDTVATCCLSHCLIAV